MLTTPVQHPHNDNHLRLPRLFASAGWTVDQWHHDALLWRDGELYCGTKPAAEYQLVWPVGLGPRQTFPDRQELLCRLPAEVCINPPTAYLALHGKSAWLAHAPPTHIALEAQPLMDAWQAAPGTWVLKPLAGSFGREVHKVSSPEDIDAVITPQPPIYWMLQAYVEDIAAGETRTLVCSDVIIGSYLRTPSDADWHTNLAVGATAQPTQLNDADLSLVNKVRAQLLAAGIRFASIDTGGGYVVEVNIANPGGLGTMAELYGEDVIHARMLQAIERLGQ